MVLARVVRAAGSLQTHITSSLIFRSCVQYQQLGHFSVDELFTLNDEAQKNSPSRAEAESDAPVHIPVLVSEIIELGNPQSGEIWVDGTAGGGGHSKIIAQRVSPSGRLIALDRDPNAAERLLSILPTECSVSNASYELIPEVLARKELSSVNGVLLDLGLSSDQLADRDRGFSFQTDGELDMRFDPTQGIPAHQWLHQSEEKTIADAIYQYGEERFSRRIARRIVERRISDPVRTASQLRDLIYGAIPGARRATSGNRKHGRVDPATRTFQALRIVVNDELGILERTLRTLPNFLAERGKLLIISFHSLEDRIVKNAFRDDPRLEVITRKPVQATEEEIRLNPRARSAKLRVATRAT